MTALWSESPRVLMEKPLEFMYSEQFDDIRNLNALVRLAVYWSIIVYFMTGQPIVFVVLIVVLVLMRRPASHEEPIVTEHLSADSKIYCQSPSINNPLANPTPNDWGMEA